MYVTCLDMDFCKLFLLTPFFCTRFQKRAASWLVYNRGSILPVEVGLPCIFQRDAMIRPAIPLHPRPAASHKSEKTGGSNSIKI